ncbi:MAG: hypothetical protein RL521_985, partial [Bacteroidota bacterium]
IQHCNQILVLDQGQLTENGNHSELLKLKGAYYRLYQIQNQREDS